MLPYFSDLAEQPVCTEATGGLGGVPGRPASACNEANLLQLPSDPFGRGSSLSGENVCVHEMAHLIMNVGLSDAERAEINARFQIAHAAGLWSSDFADTNADEFFAEMSQSYFCANPSVPTFVHTHGINCAMALQVYDLATFRLIDAIYRGPADLR